MLTDEGLVLLKFWIHLSKKRPEAAPRAAGEGSADALARHAPTTGTRWRLYGKSHDLWEHVLRETSTGAAPWYVVEGTDDRYRNLTVGKILLDAMQRTIAAKRATRAAACDHAGAVGDRQRQADPRARPVEDAAATSSTSATSRSTRASSRG